MAIVDSHCHASLAWYEPIESLLFEMDRNGVDQAVLIQIQGQTNNEYQFECVRRYLGRFASVVLVDHESPTAVDHLRRAADRGAIGLRLRAGARSPGDDPLAIWRDAARLQLAISCAGSTDEFASPAFAALVSQLPDLTFVIEHLGSLKAADARPERQPVVQALFELSRFTNVCMKVPGLGEFCARATPVREPFPFAEPIPPFLRQALEAFGPRRLLWGSDYPPVSGREGYANALAFTREQFGDASDDDRADIFGGAALAVFGMAR